MDRDSDQAGSTPLPPPPPPGSSPRPGGGAGADGGAGAGGGGGGASSFGPPWSGPPTGPPLRPPGGPPPSVTPPPLPHPPRRRGRWVPLVVIGVLALIFVGVAVFALAGGDTDDDASPTDTSGGSPAFTLPPAPSDAPPPSPDETSDPPSTATNDTADPSTPSTPSTSSVTTPGSSAPEPDDGTTEAISGDDWVGIHPERRPDIAYDVPGDWDVQPPGMLAGYEEPDPSCPFGYCPTVVFGGVAWVERKEACEAEDDEAAAVGSNGAGELVDTRIARPVAIEWAKAAYGDRARLRGGQPVAYTTNGLAGHLAKVDVELDNPCGPSTARVWVFSFRAPQVADVYNVIIYADADGPQAVDEDVLETVMGSVRPFE